MLVSFDSIKIGEVYSRIFLAKIWGYSAYQALARGVVTPKRDSKIILFVTADKQKWIQ
jgi:putative restriction endonuclease